MNAAAGRGLGARLARLIRETGPISLAHYMSESNARYYDSRDPLGGSSDFITAPEISQIFGELVGIWLADIWTRAGRSEPVCYVELGPGRGTLASDALRSAKRFGLAPQVHLVEGSSALRAVQSDRLAGARHHHDLSSVPTHAPLLIVANEFFDALPIRQLVRTPDGWRERLVGLEEGAFAFVSGATPMDGAVPGDLCDAPPGSVIETSPASTAIMGEIGRRLAAQGGAALVIDYGSLETRTGETLQAIRAHKKVGVFDHPGEADLTAHVDFAMLAEAARLQGARVSGMTEQGAFLAALGFDARHAALTRSAPDRADMLARQRERLLGKDQMGTLFKVLGLAAPGWPDGAGFRAAR